MVLVTISTISCNYIYCKIAIYSNLHQKNGIAKGDLENKIAEFIDYYNHHVIMKALAR